MQIFILAGSVAWHIHSSTLLECVRPGNLSVPELQRQRLSPLIDHAFVPTVSLLRNARWGFCGLLLPPSTPPLPEAHRGRQACGWPPSGTQSHTGLIHLASGNRHLSLRMPPGTDRQGLILGWGARRCDALWKAYRHILTHTPCSVCCSVIKDPKVLL